MKYAKKKWKIKVSLLKSPLQESNYVFGMHCLRSSKKKKKKFYLILHKKLVAHTNFSILNCIIYRYVILITFNLSLKKKNYVVQL